jgi:hypothetical protein
VLNYTAAVIPVTKADESVDILDNTYQPISDLDRANWDACKYLLPESCFTRPCLLTGAR